MSFLRMDKVNELDWVPNEEYWCVVSNHIVVSFLSIELNSETTGITITIVCSTLSSNS